MRRKILPLVALSLSFLLVLDASAAERRRSAEPPPPPQFRVDVATRTIALQKLTLSIPAGSVVGKYSPGLICITDPQPIYSEHAFAGIPTRDYAATFATEAGAAGYKVADMQSGNMFETENQSGVELVVGAAINSLEIKGCGSSSLTGTSIESEIGVDWQVFDPLAKKIVYRTTTRGMTSFRIPRMTQTFPIEGARKAFQQAAKALLSDPNFVVAVRDPRGGPPAEPGVLFPEANTSAAPQAGPAHQAVQVARLPLSSTPFRQQVTDLMKQVVTVINPVATGSGFYIADGLILTNQHVINGYTDVHIKFFGDREIAGRVIATDARRDVALIKTDSVGVHGLPLRTERPEIASPTFVIGSPRDPKYEGSVISGIVSGFRDHEYGPMIQSDVNVTHGNSGGPMFDEHGNVIGLVDLGIPGDDGQATAINLFIPIADALAKLNIQATLAAGAAPILASAPPQSLPPQPAQQVALSAPATREIKVMMFPAAGPVKNGGHSGALAGVAAGVGTSGTFTFGRPDGVSCNGRWTTLQTKPQSGSLVDKHQKVTGLPGEVTGMVGGLAIGSCSNSASFQAEYYAVPGADSGFGAAEDSDGNIYKIIF